jgi:hypothetical protein
LIVLQTLSSNLFTFDSDAGTFTAFASDIDHNHDFARMLRDGFMMRSVRTGKEVYFQLKGRVNNPANAMDEEVSMWTFHSVDVRANDTAPYTKKYFLHIYNT